MVRQAVFIVEQTCIYQDADALDRLAWHLIGYDPGSEGDVLAYARVNPPGDRFAEASIGRVLTAPAARRLGLGEVVVTRCISWCRQQYPSVAIKISAQTYLLKFYGGLGFSIVGKPYDEDGIEHIDMRLPPSTESSVPS